MYSPAMTTHGIPNTTDLAAILLACDRARYRAGQWCVQTHVATFGMESAATHCLPKLRRTSEVGDPYLAGAEAAWADLQRATVAA